MMSAAMTRLSCGSRMWCLKWREGDIIAPVDDPTAEPVLPLDNQSHNQASDLLSLRQAMLLQPRGPDRHPIITPSHEPRAFFHILQTRFFVFFINPHSSAEMTKGKEREIKGLRGGGRKGQCYNSPYCR